MGITFPRSSTLPGTRRGILPLIFRPYVGFSLSTARRGWDTFTMSILSTGTSRLYANLFQKYHCLTHSSCWSIGKYSHHLSRPRPRLFG